MFLLQERKVQKWRGGWFLHDVKLYTNISNFSPFLPKAVVISLIYSSRKGWWKRSKRRWTTWKRWCKKEMKEGGNIINLNTFIRLK